MSSRYDLLEQTLRNSGYSMTSPRKYVFDALESQEPLTIQSIVTSLHEKINRASVYRTISLFEKLGIVQRLQQGWKYKLELSDAFHHHHHHFSCTECGQTIPLHEDSLLENRIDTLATEHGFTPLLHQLEIQGVCKSCKQTSP